MTRDKIDKIVGSGIDINMWGILSLCSTGESTENLPIKCQGWILLLQKKGLVDTNFLPTEAGRALLSSVEGESMAVEALSAPKKEKGWIDNLYTHIQEELVKQTGKPQKKLRIGKTEYPFLCNKTELENQILEFMRIYKLSDVSIIEKCLIRHCKNESPTMFYYIIRKKPTLVSQLATDYEAVVPDEEEIEQISSQKFI